MSTIETIPVCGTPVVIEPGKTYVVEVDAPMPLKYLQEMRESLEGRSGATFIILGPNVRLARESSPAEILIAAADALSDLIAFAPRNETERGFTSGVESCIATLRARAAVTA